MADKLFNVVAYVGQIVSLLIVVRALVSFFRIPPDNRIYQFLMVATEPILSPIRKLLGKYQKDMMIDFSPIIALLGIRYVLLPFLYILIRAIF